MTKKTVWVVFVLASVLLLALMAATAIFRYQGSQAFYRLTENDPGASREDWERWSIRWEVAQALAEDAFMLYPLAALLLWLCDSRNFWKSMGLTLATAALCAGMMYAVPLLTDGRVGWGDMRYVLLVCLLSYLKVFVACLLVWWAARKYRKRNTIE